MGLQIGEIISRREIEFSELNEKIIAVDAFNTLYQFLTTIRQIDGTPLMDNNGKITSHLSGLFYRTINLILQNIKPVFVFDGKPPELKKATAEIRKETKEQAQEKYEEAKKRGNIEEMAKYSRQLTKLDDEMIEESKKLLNALGIPHVQAPSEGEAQASFMAKTDKKIFAVGSQDYDSLLFGTPRLIQNLTLARKKRLPSGIFINIHPELIEIEKVLNTLQINLDQLICLGILAGTDYNPSGVRGIGPKKALQVVMKYKQPFLIFKSVENIIDFDWQDIFELFKNPSVTGDYKIEFKKINEERIKKILCEKHDFSEERINSALEKIEKKQEEHKQKDLKKWF